MFGQRNVLGKMTAQHQRLIQSERGAVSVMVIMVLLLLTIAGIASLYTARTEIQIAGNERDYVSALSSSDAALNEAAQRLTHSSRWGTLLDDTSNWIIFGSQSDRERDMDTVIDSFLAIAGGTAPASAIRTHADIGPDAYYSAIYWGHAQGSSLDITQSEPLVEYTLYGFYNRDLGSGSSIRSLVESGYRNR